MAIGSAATITTCFCMQKTDIKYVGLAVAAGALGSIVPDIDAEGGSTFKKIFKTLLVGTLLFALILFLEYKDQNLDARILVEQMKGSKFIIGFLLFIVLCIIGMFTPHRTFTHWLIAIPIYSLPIYLMFGIPFTIFFAIGFLSHQLIDLLNKKKQQFLFPLPMDCATYKFESESGPSSAIGIMALVLFIVILILMYHTQILNFFL